MYGKIKEHLQKELTDIKEAGLYKKERIIVSPQQAEIRLDTGQEVLNFCANNYLGLSNHPELVAAAKEGLDSHGFGMSSVRFICGTTDIHKTLEKKLPNFLVPKIPSFMQPALMPMVVCLNRCSVKRMPSYPTHSTTLPLLTV